MDSPPPHELRALQLDAYKKVVKCFLAGPCDLAKEEALAMLRQVLHISNDDHLRLRQEVRAEQQQGAPLPHPTLQVQASRAFSPRDLYSGAAMPASPSCALSSDPAPLAPNRSRAGVAAAGAGQPRKRLKADSGGGSKRGSKPRLRGAAPAAAVPAAGLELNPLVGRKVLRYWPQDGGWFEGIISDFNPATGEHCVVYDFGLPSESYEWYSVTGAPAAEFQLLQERLDMSQLPGLQHNQKQPQRQPGAAKRAATPVAGVGRAGLADQVSRQQQQQASQQRGRGAARAAAPVRQRSNVAGQPQRGQNGGPSVIVAAGRHQSHYGYGGIRAPLERDWSSGEDEGEGEEAAADSDRDWGSEQASDGHS